MIQKFIRVLHANQSFGREFFSRYNIVFIKSGYYVDVRAKRQSKSNRIINDDDIFFHTVIETVFVCILKYRYIFKMDRAGESVKNREKTRFFYTSKKKKKIRNFNYKIIIIII